MAGDLRISYLVEMNAQRARAEAAALRGDVDNLSKSVEGTGRAATTAAPAISKIGDASTSAAAEIARMTATGTAHLSVLQMVRGSVTPLTGAYTQVQMASRQVSEAEVIATQSASSAAAAHDQLTRAIRDVVGPMTAAGSSFDGTAAAAMRAGTALERVLAVNTSLSGLTGQAIAAHLQHRDALDDIRARFDPLFAASRRYEMELRAIAEAERDGALSATVAAGARSRAAEAMAPMTAGARQFGVQAQNATHYATQLGYQANDIFMMIAAGQNPMMLMMQQGTQVTQVFGQMRAEGLKIGPAIRGSLLGMINPLSLVTMGAIALGAFAVQALMGMREETKSAKDALSDMQSAITSWGSITKRETSEIERDFGRITPAIAQLNIEMAKLAQVEAILATAAAVKSLKGEVDATWTKGSAGNLAELLGRPQTTNDVQADPLTGEMQQVAVLDPVIEKFSSALDRVESAKGVTAQLTAVRELNGLFVASVGGIDAMTTSQAEFYGQILATEQVLARTAKMQLEQRQQEAALKRAAGIEDPRLGGRVAVDTSGPLDKSTGDARRRADDLIAAGLRENEIAQASLVYGKQSAEVRAIQTRHAAELLNIEIARLGIGAQSVQAEQLRANLKARQAQEETARQNSMAASVTQMIGQYQQEAEIARLTAAYGADSLEVSYARVNAERDVQVALLASQGITGLLADSAMDAWDAARGIAAVNMAAGIGAAADEAILLAANLGVSLNKAAALMGLAGKAAKAAATPARVSFSGVGSVAPSGSGTALGFGPTDAAGVPQIRVDTPDTGGSSIPRTGRAGGGGGAASERNALDELIAAQKREIAVLRELDPVKREMLENSKALAKATPEERKEVEALIRTRIAEKTALEAVQRAQEELRGTMKSAFVGWVTGANSFRDALGQIAGKLAEMAASSAFDTIWAGATTGGGGGGGWFGNILKWITGGTPAHADGGMIAGAGGPREDNHLVRVSAGEYIVNAAATAGALPLLEMINAGVPMSKLVDLIAGRRMLAFADGGQVGVSSVGRIAPPSWAATSAATSEKANAAASGKEAMIMNFNLNGATGNSEIQELLESAITAAMTHYDREILPARVGRIAGAGSRERG